MLPALFRHFAVYWVACRWLDPEAKRPPLELVARVSANQVLGAAVVWVLARGDTAGFAPWHVFAWAALQQVWFWLVHRALHSRALWRFHRLHHRVVIVRGYTAFYCSPEEHVALNAASVALGPALLPGPMWVVELWSALATAWAVAAHACNEPARNPHQTHHLRPDRRYGAGPIGALLDRLARTA